MGEQIKVSVNCWDLEVADTLVYRCDIQSVQLIAHAENGDNVLKSGAKALHKLMKRPEYVSFMASKCGDWHLDFTFHDACSFQNG